MRQIDSLPLDWKDPAGERIALGAEAFVLKGFAESQAGALLAQIGAVIGHAPLRQMTTPGGWRMSVAMTNCGKAGWVTDRSGYRYDATDPDTGKQWPEMPALFSQLAADAAAQAGHSRFLPDACLINAYGPGARLSLHQDRNERDFSAPIVSVSLGLPAVFLWGGQKRTERPVRVPLAHGDVVVWGGVDRLRFHGVNPLAEGFHQMTGALRYNLTFRKAG